MLPDPDHDPIVPNAAVNVSMPVGQAEDRFRYDASCEGIGPWPRQERMKVVPNAGDRVAVVHSAWTVREEGPWSGHDRWRARPRIASRW